MKALHIPYGKKLPSLLILLLLTLSALHALNVNIIEVSAVEYPAIYIEPATTVDPTLMPSKNYTISIKTNYTGSDVWGYEFSLTYNPDVLHGGPYNITDTWTGDNVTTVFNTTYKPIVSGSDEVYVNQTLMTKPANYTIDYKTGAITFTTVPGVGAEIKAVYLYGGVTNGDLITTEKSPTATFMPGTFDNEAGTLSLTGAFFFYIFGTPFLTSGPGTLATVTFRVVGIGSSEITLGTDTTLKGRTAPPEYTLYNIIDAATMPTHIGHGFFNNKLIGSIAGKVTDVSTGLPIPGATVTAVGPETRSTTTAGDGTYSLDDLLVGDYTVTASAAGYYSDSKPATVTENVTTPMDLAVEPILVSGWIDGKVTDAKAGSAIVDATVTADGFIGFTNETGYYSIEVPAPGTYTVTASMPGYYDDAETGVPVPEGATTTVNFILQPIIGWIDGKVTDASTGGSIEGANVTAGDYSATTNASGYYLIADVPVGTYTIIAEATGHYSDSKPATVTENATTTVNFDLEPFPGAINGTVTDKLTTLPIAGATVTTTPGNYSATTDASGTYVISDVPAGTYPRIGASANGYTDAYDYNIVVTSSNTTTVNFQLTPLPGTIAGTVTDASTGDPIAGATVTADGNSATTDANGAYTINNVSPGDYTVTASAAKYAEQSKTVTAETTTTLDFELTLLNGTISGIVVDSSTGDPISGATVTVTPGDYIDITDADGYYNITDVPVGTYTVTVSADGYHSSSQTGITVTAGETTIVDFELTPVQPLNILLYVGVAAIAIITIAGIAVYILKVRKTKPA